jgi:hypothetical protein
VEASRAGHGLEPGRGPALEPVAVPGGQVETAEQRAAAAHEDGGGARLAENHELVLVEARDVPARLGLDHGHVVEGHGTRALGRDDDAGAVVTAERVEAERGRA